MCQWFNLIKLSEYTLTMNAFQNRGFLGNIHTDTTLLINYCSYILVSFWELNLGLLCS